MPRLPRNVPESKPSEWGDDKISAALVFACTKCWSTDHWGFTAYNHNGQVWQIRRCFSEWCNWNKDGGSDSGKWITQDEQSERTRYQIEGDAL